jgi:hypothetical protein
MTPVKLLAAIIAIHAVCYGMYWLSRNEFVRGEALFWVEYAALTLSLVAAIPYVLEKWQS